MSGLIGNYRKTAISLVLALLVLAGALAVTQGTALAVAIITATKSDLLVVDVNGDGNVDPGDTIRYEVVIQNSGSSDATGAAFNDTIDSNTTLVGGSLSVTPIARHDSYSVTGNVGLDVPVGSGLLANDDDPDGGTISVTAFDATSTNGGTVSVNANGSFTYDPLAGFKGPDSFGYTITDNETDTDTATALLNVSDTIWFVDASAGIPGDGRLNSPFQQLAGAGNSFDTLATDLPGDTIFLADGSYNGGLTLLDNQKLIGDGSSVSLEVATGIGLPSNSNPLPIPNGTSPGITSTSDAINLSQGNTIRGLDIGNATGTGIKGTSVGISTTNEVSINNNTGAGVDINGGTLNFTFDSISTNGGANGISLNSTGGSFSVIGDGSTSGSGGTIQDATSDGIILSSASGVSLSFMDITNNGNAVGEHGIDITNIGGTFTFNSLDVSGSAEHNIRAVNTSGTSTLNINNSTIENNSLAFGADGLNVETQVSANTTVNISSTDFNGNQTQGFQGMAIGGSTLNTTVTGNTFDGNNEGIVLSTSGNGDLNFDVSGGNSFVNHDGTNLFVGTTSAATSTSNLEGTINGNTFTTPSTGVNNSVILHPSGDSTAVIDFSNNIVNNAGQLRGLFVTNTDANGDNVDLDLTIENNSISSTDPTSFFTQALYVESRRDANVCASIQNNTLSTVFASDAAVVRQRDGSSHSLERFVGNGAIATDVQNHVSGENGGATTFATIDTSFTGVANGACTTPSATLLTSADANSMFAFQIDPADAVTIGSAMATDTNIANESAIEDAKVSASGETVNVTLGTLNPGQTVTITFDVTVDSPFPAGPTFVANQGLISGTNISNVLTDDPDTGAANDPTITPVDTTVVVAPDLNISKTDGDVSVLPGDTISYTITFENVGNADATGVIVTELVPANTTFNAGASTGGWVCLPNGNAGGLCTIAIGTVSGNGGGGSLVFAVDVDNPTNTTIISNNVSITTDGNNGADTNLGNNVAFDTTPVIVVAPDLNISKTDGDVSVLPGDTISYTITFENVGNADATGVIITELVPANTTFNAGASTVGWVCLPNGNAGGLCTIAIGTVSGNGGGGSLVFAVDVDNPTNTTIISNNVSITTDGNNGADTNLGNNVAFDTTPVIVVAPDLNISKTDGDVSVLPGDTISYTITFENVGNADATGVIVTELVPANTTFNAGASTGGWVCLPNGNAGGLCTIAIGTVSGNGGGGSLVFAVDVDNPTNTTIISNNVSITTDGNNGADTNLGNNVAFDTTPVIGGAEININAFLQLDSIVVPPTGATPAGSIFTISATFTNISVASFENLFFRVDELGYVSNALPAPELNNRDGGTPSGVGAELTVDLTSLGGTLDPGESVTADFDVLLPSIEGFSFFVSALTTLTDN